MNTEVTRERLVAIGAVIEAGSAAGMPTLDPDQAPLAIDLTAFAIWLRDQTDLRLVSNETGEPVPDSDFAILALEYTGE